MQTQKSELEIQYGFVMFCWRKQNKIDQINKINDVKQSALSGSIGNNSNINVSYHP